MTELELDALEMNRPRLEAMQLLRRARAGEISLHHDQWYDLVLLETGDVEAARKAKSDCIRAHLRRGLQV